MKLLNKDYVPNSSGTITFAADGSDDLWILYNMIKQGDHVSSETSRKLYQNNAKTATRVRMNMSIKVMAIDYDKEASTLRVRGKTVSCDVGGGAASGTFHTIEIKPNLPFDLTKKVWDSGAMELLKQCCSGCSNGEQVELAVVLMQESTASVHLIGRSSGSRLCAKVERKKNDVTTFFTSVLNSFVEFVNLDNTRFAIIASNGCVKNQFLEFLVMESKKRRIMSITNNISKIALINVNSKQSLKDVVESSEVKKMVSGSIDAEETEVYRAFSNALDSGKACYGTRSVEMAVELVAVEMLLITDELYKSCDLGKRRKYENLVEDVKKSGGSVRVFSSETVNGKELGKMTGVAAVLRFPVPDLDDLEL
ncbi:hypothetical protein Scep_025140 [Stephania cephalantha]|uniref:eRF1/Pelota-like N-terminal domain-containing protein n=1 Tax=Stephania cephalantha TaxID=152367 RepID=A0AAP0EHN3_9MAGN